MDMIITLGKNSATALFSCTGCAKIESCRAKKEDRNPGVFSHLPMTQNEPIEEGTC